MAGSRAASAREPGQIREEAALSVTARAPRTSLAGADGRRARPGTNFGDGCTVRLHTRGVAEANEAVVRKLVERWNAGDNEGTLALYHEDVVQHAGSHWPEQGTWIGREQMRENIDEWRAVWESVEVEVASIESHGDKVLGTGCWKPRGRVSGLGGDWPFAIVLTLRDGKIAVIEWFPDYETALAAARDA
jgi:ketosteroid isomerase-like protein